MAALAGHVARDASTPGDQRHAAARLDPQAAAGRGGRRSIRSNSTPSFIFNGQDGKDHLELGRAGRTKPLPRSVAAAGSSRLIRTEEDSLPVSFSRLRIAGFKSFAEPAVGGDPARADRHRRSQRLRQVERRRRAALGDGREFAAQPARRRDGRRHLRRHRRPPLAQPRRGDAAAGPKPRARCRRPSTRRRSSEVSRRIERGSGSRVPRQRPRGAGARRADAVRRPRHRRALLRRWSARAASPRSSTRGRTSAAAILEEAAGITGLHARRHEAELKLRAAEANLGRAEDLKGQLEGQLEALKRQARQANRYRNISGPVRNAEAELLAIAAGAGRGRRAPRLRRRCTRRGPRSPRRRRR